jgi:hypothetical protein
MMPTALPEASVVVVVRIAVSVASDGICVAVYDAVVPDTTTIDTEGFEACEVELAGKAVMVAPLVAVIVGMKLEILNYELEGNKLTK